MGGGFRPGGGDVDAEELFRAFFGGAGGAGGGHGHFGGGSNPFAQFFPQQAGAAGAGASRAGAQVDPTQVNPASQIAANVWSACSSNPWILLTGIILLSSLWSVLEFMLVRPWLFVVPFIVPAHLRKPAAMVFFFLLTSGILM